MFAFRISRAPLTQACYALRTFCRTTPALDASEERANAIRGLAELVQSAADQQQQDEAALPNTLLETPKPFAPNKFISPHQLGREHRINRTERRRKEPTLGPSRKHAQAIDAFRKLDIDPLAEFKNPSLLKSFVSEMGKIQSRAKTGLTWRSQRRVGKAVRRARALGFVPLWNAPDPTGPRLAAPNWNNPTASRGRS